MVLVVCMIELEQHIENLVESKHREIVNFQMILKMAQKH